MIVKISAAGADPGNLVRYLAGPGRNGEHVNQRCVAGTVEYPGQLDSQVAAQVAADLRMPSQMHPDVKVSKGEIYHVSLSLAAGEGDLSDGKWRAIAEDYMRGMGYTDPAKAPMRWTAVHHGLNTKGNAHIHIVGNLIREDGTKVNTWQDMPRSQKLATKLEQQHGLDVLQSRLAEQGAGSVPYSAGEAGKARDQGHPIDRLELERRVRSLAGSSSTEAEFVRRARQDGLLIRAYPAKGEVTGYSVGLPAPPDQTQVFFQGGKLARDLSLPRLRAAWPDGGGSAAVAAHEWRIGPDRASTSPSAPMPTQAAVQQELAQLGERLTSADPAEFVSASHDLAGVLAAGSRVVEGGRIGPIGAASRDTGAWAQTRRPPAKVARKRAVGRGSALLLMQALDPTGPMGQAVMYRQLIDAAMALYQLHRARRPVAVRQGRGARMPGDDGFDDTLESFGTVGITLAARGVQQWAENRREIEGDAPGYDPDAIEDPAYREYVREGGGIGEGGVSEEEYRGMSDDQRRQVAPKPDPKKSPLDWADAAAPVTGPQRYTLIKAGLTSREVDQLDKGHASLVIDAIPDGPAKMRQVYDNNTAGALIMGAPGAQQGPAVAAAAGRTPTKPPIVPGPAQGRNPRRL